MKQKLLNKVAVVTGGSQGIGSGIVKKLALEGANVVFTYNSNREAAELLLQEIASLGAKAIALQVDVTSEADLDALFEQASVQYGKIDILVNNAGVFIFNPIEALTLDEVEHIFRTNVFAPMFTVQSALSHFNDQGVIINIGSITATSAPKSAIAYSSSKAALHGITKVLSKELAARGIRVNQINPGPILTERAKIKLSKDEERREELLADIPLGRLGTPEDVANLTAFLASEDSEWMTGEIITLSGGAR